MCALFQSSRARSSASPGAVPNEFPEDSGRGHCRHHLRKASCRRFLRLACESAPSGFCLDCSMLPGAAKTIRQSSRRRKTYFELSGAELFSGARLQRSRRHDRLCIRLNRGLMEAARGVRSCPAFIGLLPRKVRHSLLHQRRTHPGLLSDQYWHHGTDFHWLAAWLVLPRHLRCSHGRACEKARFCLLVSRGVVEGKCKDDKDEDWNLAWNASNSA